MAPMIALGNGNDTEILDLDYGFGDSSFFGLLVFSSDAEPLENTGFADLRPIFILNASGHDLLPDRAYLRSHNEFRISAYGGGTAEIKVPPFTIEAEATGTGVGQLYGVIGYS
jgi:hypothetical protein